MVLVLVCRLQLQASGTYHPLQMALWRGFTHFPSLKLNIRPRLVVNLPPWTRLSNLFLNISAVQSIAPYQYGTLTLLLNGIEWD